MMKFGALSILAFLFFGPFECFAIQSQLCNQGISWMELARSVNRLKESSQAQGLELHPHSALRHKQFVRDYDLRTPRIVSYEDLQGLHGYTDFTTSVAVFHAGNESLIQEVRQLHAIAERQGYQALAEVEQASQYYRELLDSLSGEYVPHPGMSEQQIADFLEQTDRGSARLYEIKSRYRLEILEAERLLSEGFSPDRLNAMARHYDRAKFYRELIDQIMGLGT